MSSVVTRKKRIVFLGTPPVAADALRALYEASLRSAKAAADSAAPHSGEFPDYGGFEITAVVTQPAKRRQRGGTVVASAVGIMARTLGIPAVLEPETMLRTADAHEFLRLLADELRPDLCVTAAYGQYLPRRFLATPVYGTVNLHPSLLPRWRGASPVQRALEAGDDIVGVSLLFTVPRMDAGPIIAQERLAVHAHDTAATVLPALFRLGTHLLLDRLPAILSGNITAEHNSTPQQEDDVVLAPRIDASEAEFKVWRESALTCHNRLRGFNMWPQAYMWLRIGKRPDLLKVKVLQTRVVVGAAAACTDIVILGPTKQSGLYVTCHDRSVLELVTVQPATRKAFPARDLHNGYPGEIIRWVQPPSPPAAAGSDAAAVARAAADGSEAQK